VFKAAQLSVGQLLFILARKHNFSLYTFWMVSSHHHGTLPSMAVH